MANSTRQLRDNQQCSTEGLLVEIQDTYNIEMHIAKRSKQKQYEEFEEKWGVLEGIMS